MSKKKPNGKAEPKQRKPVVISTTPTKFEDKDDKNFMVIDLRQIIMQFGGAPYALVFRRIKGKDNVNAVDLLFEQSAITTEEGVKIAKNLNKWWKPEETEEQKPN